MDRHSLFFSRADPVIHNKDVPDGRISGQNNCPFWGDHPVCDFCCCCLRWVDYFRDGTREGREVEGRWKTDSRHWLNLEGKARCVFTLCYNPRASHNTWHWGSISHFSVCVCVSCHTLWSPDSVWGLSLVPNTATLTPDRILPILIPIF